MTVKDLSFTFRQRTFEDLPDARGFLTALLDRGSISPPVAAQYTKIAAKLARQGRLGHPELITHPVERTAANAYLRWAVENYAVRISKIGPAFASYGLGARVRFLRRHSLVQPYPGKLIPVVSMPAAHEAGFLAARFPIPDPDAPPRTVEVTASIDAPLPLTMVPAADAWTLHVPTKFTAPHVDPCSECTAIVLDTNQLNVLAEAIEKGWGHRDLAQIPMEAHLFGTPPPDVDIAATKEKPEKFVALVGHTVTRDELSRIGGRTVNEMASFVARLEEGSEGVYLSRAACGERLGDVLGAVWKTWS